MMKSLLLAGALAFAAIPVATPPSQADALIITSHDHVHDGDHQDADKDLHTGAIVVHKDDTDHADCKTKTVTKSDLDGDKTVTKTKRKCD